MARIRMLAMRWSKSCVVFGPVIGERENWRFFGGNQINILEKHGKTQGQKNMILIPLLKATCLK
jgi:hypothetical protein